MPNRQYLVTDEWTREKWALLSSQFSNKSIYQVWEYADLHSVGAFRSVLRAGLVDGKDIVALAQMRVKSLPGIPSSVAELEWGPLYNNATLLSNFLEQLRVKVVEELGWELRIHPRSTFNLDEDKRLRQILEEAGYLFQPDVRPYQTVVLNLKPDLDILYGGLRGSWRRHHRKAEATGLVIDHGNSVEYFDRFQKVYGEMWGSKQFITGVRHPIIRQLMETLKTDEQLSVAIATLEGRDVGASVCATVGNTMYYFLGASSPGLREGCQPGYLLHWDNVRMAKEEGFEWYDLGGIVDTGEGVNRFKRGMGATEIVFPGCFVAGADRFSARLYHSVEDTFRVIRHWMTKR